jgi:PPOX class probable FMN-dependent enzyme
VSEIRSLEHLRGLIGEPAAQVAYKFHRRLNAAARAFVTRSPLLFLATTDPHGQPAVSPKGGVPGFVLTEDDSTLLLPERKGNKLVFSLQNILVNPRVALIFLVPGTGETLRVSGTARLLDDSALCERFASRGRPALLVLKVSVEQCYFHCAKAFLRSNLWNLQTWPDAMPISFGSEICEEGGLPAQEIGTFDAAVQGRYKTDL